MTKIKKAIYPGSFDPITNGHVDIINRASTIFDEILISVIQNPEKNPFYSIEERLNLIKEIFRNNKKIKVESFHGLLAEYAKQKKINTIIRGLRAVSDFDFEFQMALTNRKLNPDLDTVFFMTDQKYSYLSSSLVRQVARLNGPITSFVPIEVENALKIKFKVKGDSRG